MHTSHKIMNGAFDNYVGNEKKIPTTNNRRNFTNNESNLRVRGGSKRNTMNPEGEGKLLALENLYFRSNIASH